MKEIVTTANEFVRQYEHRLAKGLVQDVIDAKRHAVVCGCPNCKKSVEGAKDALSREAIRIYPEDDPVDHEEEWIKEQKL